MSTLRPCDTVWWNGKLVPRERATVPVTTHALHYATAAFEGIRAYWNGENLYVFRLHDHIRRLLRSGTFYGIVPRYTHQQMCDAVTSACAANGLNESTYIRPLYFVGEWGISLHVQSQAPTHMAVIVFRMGNYFDEKGISACMVSYRRFSDQATPVQAKMAGNYLNSIIATAEAKQNGFEEAIMLDHAGNLSELPGANIFLVQDNALITPDVASSALNGITRDTVIRLAVQEGIDTVQRRVLPGELYTSDEVFVTGTAAEVVPLTRIGGHAIKPGPTTKIIREAYLDTVMGRRDAPPEWLTPVYAD